MVLHKYRHSTYHETKHLLGTDDDLTEPILFREKLYIFDESGKRIGRFSVCVNLEDKNRGGTILYVHISSRAYIDGKLSESIVTGTVSPKLKTLEEIRYEYTEMGRSKPHERSMFLIREATRFYLSVTNKIGDVKNQFRSTFPFVQVLGLFGECSNVVFLRRLATKGYEGIISSKTFLSNGKLCKNYYVTKLSQQVINGKKIEVLIVYRNITDHKKYNVTMTMALTKTGQIVYLFWSNSKFFIHIDPDVQINSHRFTSGNPELKWHWHKDAQLHSLYLDKVDELLLSLRSYKYRNGALIRILKDFVQYVILMRPENVLCFAIEFFTSFLGDSFRKCAPKIPSRSAEVLIQVQEQSDAEEQQEQEDEYSSNGAMEEFF